MQINTEKCLGSSLKEHFLSLRFVNYHSSPREKERNEKILTRFAWAPLVVGGVITCISNLNSYHI